MMSSRQMDKGKKKGSSNLKCWKTLQTLGHRVPEPGFSISPPISPSLLGNERETRRPSSPRHLPPPSGHRLEKKIQPRGGTDSHSSGTRAWPPALAAPRPQCIVFRAQLLSENGDSHRICM